MYTYQKNSNEVNFSCKVNGEQQYNSDEIIISKSNNNYLKFQPALEDKDINILVNKTIPFIKAEKLLYNKDNIWQFEITVQKYSIPLGSKSIVDILYNGTLSQANCFCNNSTSLNCFVEKDNQTEYDLIKIQFIQSSKSTITWEDLTYVYEIPIEKELDYINITDLTSSSNKQLWTYKINFENGILPQNGLVKVDFNIKNNYTYANCYFFDSVLNCETSEINNSSLILLLYEKKYGSITWRNMNKKDIIVPVNISLDYIEAKNLTFIGGVWTFIIELEISEVIKREWTFIIKIKYGETLKPGIAYCSLISENSKIFECKAQYKNQKKKQM